MATNILNQETIMDILDKCYEQILSGIPGVSKSVEEFATEYLEKYEDKEKACKELINNQVIKCTTSGFLTGFGGFITLPVTLPANITSVLYVQMRMIASIAYICGYELNSDKTQTFVYACIAGVSVGEIIKQTSIKLGVKISANLVKKIPGKVLTKINQKVGFRLLTKFGSKGIVNIGKLVPGVGAVIGGVFDFKETQIIGDRAYSWFVDQNFEDENLENVDKCIEIE